jgi:hypothetical protein
MQRSDLLAIMATLLIREQCVSAQASQFEGAVDDAEALLKVIESRRSSETFLAKSLALILAGIAGGVITKVASWFLK